MILSGLVPVAFALAIGIPLLSKLHGDYFALGTLGFGEILKVVFIKEEDNLPGDLSALCSFSVYTTMKPAHYWTALFLALLATGVVYFMTKSRVGLALVAISEDETAASSSGIHILKYKVLAFAISAFLSGMCGSLYAYYLFQVSPEVSYPEMDTFIRAYVCHRWKRHSNRTYSGQSSNDCGFTVPVSTYPGSPFSQGIIIILVMLFMPNGITRLWKKGCRAVRCKIERYLKMEVPLGERR